MKIFLRAKHWQLFIVLVGLPFITWIILITQFLSGTITAPDDLRPEQIFANVESFLPKMLVLGLFVTWVMFRWFYSVGVNLHKKLPLIVKMPVRTFKAFVIIPMVYVVLVSIAMVYFFNHLDFYINGTQFNPPPYFFFFPLLIMPLHLFCVFCIFYCFYFIAKCLKAVELQKNVTTGDYIGEFFLLWFFFVGVWFIQPRVNKLFADDASQPEL